MEGSGPPVLLVAGGPGNSHIRFHPWFSQLAKAGYQVIYFDNIGRGHSDRPADGIYSVSTDVDDIEAVRKGLDLERLNLIGHSYGGMPALAYAVRYPGHVGKLVMSSAVYDAQSWQETIDNENAEIRRQFPETWEKLMAFRAKGVLSNDDAYGNLMDASYLHAYWYDVANLSKTYKITDPKDRWNFKVYLALAGPDPEWEIGGTLKGYAVLPEASKLTLPVLVLSGRYDRICTPGAAWRLKQALSPATTSWGVLEGSGHMTFIEDPDGFFVRVIDFLNAK